jgi:glycosyltransferase involved in cell wall biosynthesis
LVCANAGGDDRDVALLEIDEVTPYRSRRLGFDLRHLLTDRRVEKAAARLIGRWHPDAIYERYSLYSFAGARLARRYQLPHLLEVNAFVTRELTDRIRFMAAARAAERRIFRRARHVVVVSEPLAEEIAQLRGTAGEITRLPMAVNVHNFHPGRDRAGVRERLGLGVRFVLGYVGTLTGWHGIKLLYELVERLRGAGIGPFAVIVLGGDPRRLEEHRRRVKEAGLEEWLRFLGPVPHTHVPDYIAAMDVALVPDTTYWSSPAKLFEYQGCGVPVLAPRVPAVEMALAHGEDGLIFEPGNVEELARHAMTLYQDPQRRRAMGIMAAERAAKDHSWEASALQVVGIFERQIAARGSGNG